VKKRRKRAIGAHVYSVPEIGALNVSVAPFRRGYGIRACISR
jgi:hypothetical protein